MANCPICKGKNKLVSVEGHSMCYQCAAHVQKIMDKRGVDVEEAVFRRKNVVHAKLKKKKRMDVYDTGLVLPGSYETGKRR